MAGDDFRLHPDIVQIGAQAQAQRLDAQQVDLLAEQPTRVIFAKAVGGNQRQILLIGGVGNEIGTGLDHNIRLLKCGMFLAVPTRHLNGLRCGFKARSSAVFQSNAHGIVGG